MATRVSPAAILLRKSKLFSLPPHLPGPARPLSVDPVAYSETATKIYPTHQAIVTPASSAARGDWGLKRPLPAKSTIDRSSSPIVRVNRLDTLEHITDFDSAADYTRTLQKFHELELPISKPSDPRRRSYGTNITHQSVFEEDAAVAALLAGADKQSKSSVEGEADFLPPARYRYKGPWLAGQSEAEFQEFLKYVERRKHVFLRSLKRRARSILESQARQRRIDENDTSPKIEREPFSKEAFQAWLRKARHNHEELGPVIKQVLDLAPTKIAPPGYASRGSEWATGPSNVATPDYALNGPPKTHPSAGLSYLRTNARLFNHPSYGPQKDRLPVEARLLKSARSASSTNKTATGVAGFIAANADIKQADASLQSPDVPGGLRIQTHVTRATIGTEGSVQLHATQYLQAHDYSNPPREHAQGRHRYVRSLTPMKPTAHRVTSPCRGSNERYAYDILTRR
ncbi:hypothetical protein KEM54_006585 [Ascosphaera aggregata]|nr:hypothetical protein KEM54_006585 [Ascosphaera aggregata]